MKNLIIILLLLSSYGLRSQVAMLDSHRLVLHLPAGILPQRLGILDSFRRHGVQTDGVLPRLRMQRWKFQSDAHRDTFIRKIWGQAAALSERGTLVLPSDIKKPDSHVSGDSLRWIASGTYWRDTFLPSPYCPRQVGSSAVKVGIIDCGLSLATRDSGLLNYCDIAQSRNFTYEPNLNDSETNLHGTRVASVVTRLYSRLQMPRHSKVVLFKTFNREGKADLWHILQAIDACMEQGIQIVNLSFNYDAELDDIQRFVRAKLVLEEAINIGKNYNILFVTAAGNNGKDTDSTRAKGYFPTNFECENLIKVTADYTSERLPTLFGNYGQKSVDISAPGIVEAIGLGDSLRVSAGTSFAAPIVTAIAAIEGSKLSVFDWRRVKVAVMGRTERTNNWNRRLKPTGGVLKPICSQ